MHHEHKHHRWLCSIAGKITDKYRCYVSTIRHHILMYQSFFQVKAKWKIVALSICDNTTLTILCRVAFIILIFSNYTAAGFLRNPIENSPNPTMYDACGSRGVMDWRNYRNLKKIKIRRQWWFGGGFKVSEVGSSSNADHELYILVQRRGIFLLSENRTCFSLLIIMIGDKILSR